MAVTVVSGERKRKAEAALAMVEVGGGMGVGGWSGDVGYQVSFHFR